MKKLYYSLSMTALLTLAACQGEEQTFLTPSKGVETKSQKIEVSFEAQFEDDANTRTQLVDGKKVKWNAGDEIKVFYTDDFFASGTYPPATFTTDKNGYSVIFKGTVSEESDYYALYPNSSCDNGVYYFTDQTTQEKSYKFRMSLPSQQVAIANTFADDLNISYAHSTSIKGSTLTFKNLCALIKFELSGSAVSNLSKVRFYPEATMGDTPNLTGDAFLNIEDGAVYRVSSDDNYVELAGNFESSTPYYMVVFPHELPNGFSISFINDEGKEYVKYATKGTELKANETLNLGVINVETSDFNSNEELTKYAESPRAKAVPLVIIPDGYTSSELPLFKQQATRMLDFFFSVEPYKQYKDYFNVYIIEVASEESGADVKDKGINKITYFDSGWDSKNYGNMAANEDRVYSFVEDHCPDILEGKATIFQTPIIMLVNDSRYGGICHKWSNGKGYTIVPTTRNDNTGSEALHWDNTNFGTWMNIALHEGGGHCFGRLGDEYWYESTLTYPYTSISNHFWEIPDNLNLTVNPSNPEWNIMIPSVQGAKELGKFPYVGVYEGGFVYGKGIWRSEEISCMTDNRPYFSAWQRYLIVQRIFSIVGESFSYNTFLTHDKQYADIQNGVENAGTEGKRSTIYDGLNVHYNSAGTPRNYVENPTESSPPLPPPVIHEDKKLDYKSVPILED